MSEMPRFQAMEWFESNRGRVAIVRCDRERPRDKSGLDGSQVLIDGAIYDCVGVACDMPATPIREGEIIALYVKVPA